MIRNIVNIIAFQAGWFAAVLGAGNGMPWLGVIAVPIVLAAHLALSPNRKAEGLLLLLAGAVGFFVDTALVWAGIFTPVRLLFPYPLTTPWMVLLWMNFATAINVSLKKLHGRYALSAVLGSVGGPSAYYSGAKLGATTSIPGTIDLFVLSAAWAAAVPVLFWIAARINKKYAERVP
jgi:hypothetical protein